MDNQQLFLLLIAILVPLQFGLFYFIYRLNKRYESLHSEMESIFESLHNDIQSILDKLITSKIELDYVLSLVKLINDAVVISKVVNAPVVKSKTVEVSSKPEAKRKVSQKPQPQRQRRSKNTSQSSIAS